MRVSGRITEQKSGRSVADVIVRVKDRDLVFDDQLGEAVTAPDGSYSVELDDEVRVDLINNKPDLYLVVRARSGEVLRTTRDEARLVVEGDVTLDVGISRPVLAEAGLVDREPATWMDELDDDQRRRYTTWLWGPGHDAGDELCETLTQELAARSSVLELIKQYIDDLKGNLDNDAPSMRKLARLFQLGRTPENLSGHFYGVPVGIRSGDLQGPAAGFCNLLGFVWGVTLEDHCPWVAKSFAPISASELERVSGSAHEAPLARSGINHFNKINFQPGNLASFHFLTWWMSLEPAPEQEQQRFGHERNGAHFIAARAPSVYSGTPREVIQLNYRHPELDNPPPNCWLIDELVQVAEGFYLGQLLYATRRLVHGYDPAAPASDARYQHFGYFVLFDQSWNPEARRLLAHLDVPALVPGMDDEPPVNAGSIPDKYTTFTFVDPSPDGSDDALMNEVLRDMEGQPSILHLLKHYSDHLRQGLDNDSPYFLRLRELFHRGIGPEKVEGFFRGALVSWRSEGLLRLMDKNTINLAYTKVARHFSPWTGKSFEAMDAGELRELTDGHERGEVPTYWGSNTQSLRTPATRMVGQLMDLLGIWTRKVPPEEARQFGYDLKNLFFIGRQGTSVHEHHAGKRIFQINYRWPRLKTIPPDCYCIDEMVQLAEGLYLGHLMYATDLLKPYDPTVDPAEYGYQNFGYFLLMDEQWHRIRLDIGFDMDNV